eukprot:GHVT01092910.1.p1 GENE.GHVT01092910.1~~GHVT01092910.1.p1  ORF type:complete len:168 (+),score=20.14 GHVT01092910.1:1684-2187(+)
MADLRAQSMDASGGCLFTVAGTSHLSSHSSASSSTDSVAAHACPFTSTPTRETSPHTASDGVFPICKASAFASCAIAISGACPSAKSPYPHAPSALKLCSSKVLPPCPLTTSSSHSPSKSCVPPKPLAPCCSPDGSASSASVGNRDLTTRAVHYQSRRSLPAGFALA